MKEMNNASAAVTALLFTLLVGCSDPAPEKKVKAPEKPPEAVTGRTAFYKMFGTARLWAADVQGLRCASIRLNQVKDELGATGAWECTFVSPSLQKSKSFTYSVIEAEGNLHKDVFAGLDEPYAAGSQTAPWAIQAFKIDSDAAYKEAAAKSAEYIKKNPDKSIFYLLEWNKRFPVLTWRIVWGESVGTSNYSVYIDASSGAFIEKMR